MVVIVISVIEEVVDVVPATGVCVGGFNVVVSIPILLVDGISMSFDSNPVAIKVILSFSPMLSL